MRSVIIFWLICLSLAPVQGQSDNLLMEYGRGVPDNVFWDPTADRVLVVTRSDTLWFYDAQSFATIRMLPDVTDAFYSPDGTWLFTRNSEQRWSIRAGNTVEQVIKDDFTSVKMSPDGTWILAGDETGISIRPADDPRHIQLAGLRDVQFSPDERYLITSEGSDAGFVLRDAALTPLTTQPNFRPDMTGLLWSPDGTRFAAFTVSDRVDLVDAADSSIHELILPDRKRYAGISWSPDGTRILDHDDAGNLRIWDVLSGDLTLDLPSGAGYIRPEEREKLEMYGQGYWSISWSSDGSHIFRCRSEGDISRNCSFYDSTTGATTGAAIGDGWGLDISPDGRYFVMAQGIHDASTGAVVVKFDEGIYGGYFRVWSADHQRVAISSVWTPTIIIFNLEQMQVEHTLEADPYRYGVEGMQWSPDGQQLVTWGSNNTHSYQGSGLITFRDAVSSREIGQISSHVLFGGQITFNSDSSRLAAADELGNIGIFEPASGKLVQMLAGHQDRVSLLAWQPGGRLLATTTGRVVGLGNPDVPAIDGSLVLIWDVLTGNIIARLEHEDQVLALTWNPSGRYLVSDDNKELHVWDATTQKQHLITGIGTSSANIPSRYYWTGGGDVVARGYHTCSHTSGLTIDLYDMTTSSHIGPLGCVYNISYEWIREFNGVLIPLMNCFALDANRNPQDCFVEVRWIIPLQGNTPDGQMLEEIKPAYTFGSYPGHPQLIRSPQSLTVLVITTTGAEHWTMDTNHATLNWTLNDAVSDAIWSNDGQHLALITPEKIQVMDSVTGQVLYTVQNVNPDDINEVAWSVDDTELMILTATAATTRVWVLDGITGKPVFRLNDIQSVSWFDHYLAVCRADPCVQELWNVQQKHIAAQANHFPAVISPDGRFGVETQTGALRIWLLTN